MHSSPCGGLLGWRFSVQIHLAWIIAAGRSLKSIALSAGHTELGELGGNGLTVSGGPHALVDMGDPSVGTDVERPPGRERLIRVDDAISVRDCPRRIAEERIVHPKRLREGLVLFRSIDAETEVRDVERADPIPTLTE